MSDAPKGTSPAFVRFFLPGLVLGLVVGALAGAYLSTIVAESPSLPPITGPNPNARGPGDSRDEPAAVPQPADANKTPAEAKPEEPKPEQPKPEEPKAEPPKTADPTTPK